MGEETSIPMDWKCVNMKQHSRLMEIKIFGHPKALYASIREKCGIIPKSTYNFNKIIFYGRILKKYKLNSP